jgi:hypothetical protein
MSGPDGRMAGITEATIKNFTMVGGTDNMSKQNKSYCAVSFTVLYRSITANSLRDTDMQHLPQATILFN